MFLRIATVALVCFGLAASQSCGGSYAVGDDVSSPGYPNAYGNSLRCDYTVTAGPSANFKGIEITAKAFDLENTYDCVEFFENDGTSAGKFCGSSGPNKLRLSSTTITFRFTTDSSVTRTGFVLSFTFAQCFKGEGSCPNNPEVCMASGSWCNGVQDCPDGADEDCPDPGSCGQSVAKPNGRIVGGAEVVPNSHPWQAAMLSASGSQLCGGTIISPEWIMTAAHCCDAYSPTPSSYKFRIGAHAYASAEDGASTVTLSKVIMHPSYNSPVRYAHDFCLVKTSERMTFTPKVQPACLEAEVVPEDAQVWVTGWGNTGANKGDFDSFIRNIKDIESGKIPKDVASEIMKGTTTLREVAVRVSNQEYCNRQYSNGISSDMLCGAAPGKDSCQGDSGGPLVYRKDGKSYLHGVVSWGRGCAQPNYPGVYGRMTFVNQWILETMNSN